MRASTLVPAVLLLVALAAPARAEPPDGFNFGPGRQPPPGSRTPGRTTPGEAPPPPVDPVQAEIAAEVAALASWPDRRGVLAAEGLLLRGPDIVPVLVEVLTSGDDALHPGAAWVLGRVGESPHVMVILRAAAQRLNGSRAEVFFDAAWTLDPQRTKDWLFSFLALRRPVFRAKATDFLADHVGADDHPRILRLLDALEPGVRMAGLRLLDPAKVPDAGERLMQALADTSPEVARTASVLLALRATDETIAQLNSLAREGYARDRAYAVLALVEVARTRGTNPFEEATIAELGGRRGLLHPEKLVRGAAAIGLTFGAMDSADENVRAMLDRAVVDVLVDTIGGDHFRDYPSLVEPVFASLRRLSGIDLPTTAVAWADWWRTQRGHFRARRPLTALPTDDLAQAWLRFEAVSPDGRRLRATFRPEGGGARPGDLILPAEAFRALAGAVEEAGLFQAEPVGGPRADEHVLVTLGVANQERQMAVGASDPRFPLLRMRLASLLDANRWQRYRDLDGPLDAEAWWRQNVRLMAEASPAERRLFLRSSIVYAFDDLPDDAARSEALDVLEDLRLEEEEGEGLTAAEARALVVAATSAPAFGEVEERALRLVLDDAVAPAVREDLVEALAERPEPAPRAVLADLLVQGGVPAVREAIADPRAGMRGAAARAAQRLLDDAQGDAEALAGLDTALRAGLEVLVVDPDPSVGVRALVALRRLGVAEAAARLEEIYKTSPDAGVRLAVVEALGDLPADEAYPVLSLVLAEERTDAGAALRASALAALARTGHPDAVNLLTFYLLSDADPSVRVAAGEALATLGTEEARFAVVRALTEGQQDPEHRAVLLDVLGHFRGEVVRETLASHLEDPDANVARTAALRLADMNDAVAVPYLIAIVRAGPPAAAEAAVRGLENVTTLRFEVQGHELIAAQYEQWYATARAVAAQEPDRAWFRDALKRRGYDIGPLHTYVAGDADPQPVPVLVRALRDEDPVVRRNAGIALTRITGLTFGTVDRGTSAREASRVADRWARWWERVGGVARGDR